MIGFSLASMARSRSRTGASSRANFDDYQVVRIDEAPTETRTHIVVQGLEVPSSSVGEPQCAAQSAISWRDAGLSLRQSAACKTTGTR